MKRNLNALSNMLLTT